AADEKTKPAAPAPHPAAIARPATPPARQTPQAAPQPRANIPMRQPQPAPATQDRRPSPAPGANNQANPGRQFGTPGNVRNPLNSNPINPGRQFGTPGGVNNPTNPGRQFGTPGRPVERALPNGATARISPEGRV